MAPFKQQHPAFLVGLLAAGTLSACGLTSINQSQVLDATSVATYAGSVRVKLLPVDVAQDDYALIFATQKSVSQIGVCDAAKTSTCTVGLTAADGSPLYYGFDLLDNSDPNRNFFVSHITKRDTAGTPTAYQSVLLDTNLALITAAADARGAALTAETRIIKFFCAPSSTSPRCSVQPAAAAAPSTSAPAAAVPSSSP